MLDTCGAADTRIFVLYFNLETKQLEKFTRLGRVATNDITTREPLAPKGVGGFVL
jgi:hypothetical protein